MPAVYQLPIVSNIEVRGGAYLLTLEAPEIAHSCAPGNFIQIKINFPGNGLWRRPFSILDTDRNNIRVLYKTLGRGTAALAEFKAGVVLNIIGPLGNCFSNPDNDTTVLLIGGGIGIPPLYYLTKRLTESGFPRQSIHFFNGASDYDSLTYLEETSELGINVYAVTEDGSMGIKGVVTDGARQFLSGVDNSIDPPKKRIFACGPAQMLKAVSKLAAQFNVKGEIAMEALMPCGFGICMGCVIKVADPCSSCHYSFKRVCQDGPIFNASDIIWD